MVANTHEAPDTLARRVKEERLLVYSMLDAWEDEETQVLERVPMSELVNTASEH